jgi:hypothetical protein
MGHTLKKKAEGNRRKMVYYAPQDVREFVKTQAKIHCLSQSEIVVRIIQESWNFKKNTRRTHAEIFTS